jgi:hypothetical protein
MIFARGKNLLQLFGYFFLIACFSGALPGCSKVEPLPNPVESKEGLAYIPIDDTAFLVPEKTWLTNYSRNSDDGKINSISLHATVPDVSPWSKLRDEEMYRRAGPGKKLLITIQGNQIGDYRDHFHEVPHSRMWQFKFAEEPSDQIEQGLRKFREILMQNSEIGASTDSKEAKYEAIGRRNKDGDILFTNTVYYEYIENEKVKYFIRCSDGPGPIWHICHLSFPWGRTLMIDIEFSRDDISNVVSMAKKVEIRVSEFEVAANQYLARRSEIKNNSLKDR